jgi:hypothetical protein
VFQAFLIDFKVTLFCVDFTIKIVIPKTREATTIKMPDIIRILDKR